MVGNIILQASLYYTFDYNMLSVDNEDPLLLVEWDEVGLVARSVANQAHTKILLVNRYAPFPSGTNPSDCAFGFVDTAGLPAKQAMTNAVGALVTYVNSANGNWARPVNGMPDVGRVFLIEIPKKGQLCPGKNPPKTEVGVWYNEGDYYEDDDTHNEGYYYEDKGYYHRNGRYERKVSPMTSPIISPVTA
ncbi:hypothetical protein RhiirA1_465398 [Rhizophagus irregularis]|uniref:Uncharacterized protein n=1 Tax=Rhizophagus irregularis TaxID=588596 RepID=A0A2N0RG19_9GLOM|nr:hypothetical protein RhiirA1_465398 [Rhizophagus irregularis]